MYKSFNFDEKDVLINEIKKCLFMYDIKMAIEISSFDKDNERINSFSTFYDQLTPTEGLDLINNLGLEEIALEDPDNLVKVMNKVLQADNGEESILKELKRLSVKNNLAFTRILIHDPNLILKVLKFAQERPTITPWLQMIASALSNRNNKGTNGLDEILKFNHVPEIKKVLIKIIELFGKANRFDLLMEAFDDGSNVSILNKLAYKPNFVFGAQFILENFPNENLNQLNTQNCSLSITALLNNNIEFAKLVLNDPRTDINLKTPTSSTALFFAAQKGLTEIVKLLLDKNADASLPYCVKISKLKKIAKTNNVVSQMDHLIAAKTKRKELPPSTIISITPAEIASVMGHDDIAKACLKQQINQRVLKHISIFKTTKKYPSMETIEYARKSNCKV